MVHERKKAALQKLKETISGYSAVGIIDLHQLPARQLHSIRDKIRGKATILVAKKQLMAKALEAGPFAPLAKLIQHEPALLLTNENPFVLARIIEASKSMARAKPGSIAPTDIVIKAGPTPLPPGPAIGELQKMKIPAGVEGTTISVKKDTVVAKAGDTISAELAGVLGKLNMEPMEIGVNLLVVQEGGIAYGKDVLFVPMQTYLDKLATAHAQAVALCLEIGYLTTETVPLLLAKAHREALALADAAAYPTKEGVGRLLAKGEAQAAALKKAGNL